MVDSPELVAPPRLVPTSLRLRVLFGGVFPTIGFVMLALGAPLTVGMLRYSEFATAARFAGPLQTAPGTVQRSERLPLRLESQTVSRVDFRFQIDQQSHAGSSYTTSPPPPPGARVVVEFAAGDGSVARLRGMRAAPLPAGVAFVLVLPALALLLIAGGALANRRRLALLRDGLAAWGLLTATRATNTRVNNRRVYRLEFTFLDATGARRTITESSHRAEFRNDKVARLVLYDPAAPRACLPDLTPGRPRPVDGAWQPLPWPRLLPVLLLPLLAATPTALALALT
ncbi:MAG: hypothetical protein IT455_01925 [Planctomycetes bacterium]|nr:hypothetical protein [Planctomycetota bacterium]